MRARFEAGLDKRNAVNEAEKDGIVADSHSVRLALMDKVYSGKITLEQAQKELATIKKNAKKNGLLTRSQAFNNG